jgi:hypothetical protein
MALVQQQQQQYYQQGMQGVDARYMDQRHTTMLVTNRGPQPDSPPLASSLFDAAYGQKMPGQHTSSSLFPISNDALDFHRAEHAFRWIGSWRQVRTKSVPLGPQA